MARMHTETEGALEIYDYARSLSIDRNQADVRKVHLQFFPAFLPDLTDNVGALSLGVVLDKVELASETRHPTFLSGLNSVIFWVVR
jgi:hypothetical protein